MLDDDLKWKRYSWPIEGREERPGPEINFQYNACLALFLDYDLIVASSRSTVYAIRANDVHAHVHIYIYIIVSHAWCINASICGRSSLLPHSYDSVASRAHACENPATRCTVTTGCGGNNHGHLCEGGFCSIDRSSANHTVSR